MKESVLSHVMSTPAVLKTVEFVADHQKLVFLTITVSLFLCVFIVNQNALDQNLLECSGITLLIIVFIWSAWMVMREMKGVKVNNSRLAIPVVFVHTCVRSILNIIIVLCFLCILCIFIKSQSTKPIVFNTLFLRDSWWIYPVFLFLIEHVCPLQYGQGWFEKLGVFIDPSSRQGHSSRLILRSLGVSVVTFAVLCSYFMFTQKIVSSHDPEYFSDQIPVSIA